MLIEKVGEKVPYCLHMALTTVHLFHQKSTATLEKNLETLANVLVDDLKTYKEKILHVICDW